MEKEYREPVANSRLLVSTKLCLREETKKTKPYVSSISGWPDDKIQLLTKLHPYWSFRDELSVQNGIIYKSAVVMVLRSMHKEMLHKIHTNHFGAESNIRPAREVLFWRGMRKVIQDMCNACAICAQYGSAAPKKAMESLPISTQP